jgi:arsenate reductase
MEKYFDKIESTVIDIKNLHIALERQELLKTFAKHIWNKINGRETVLLNFICTHNSRRSHLGQVWAQFFAMYFGFKNVICYSGGTESTAVYPQIIETLKLQGFKINKLSQESNPVYFLKFNDNHHPIILFSKSFDHGFNPLGNFIAIMTCSDADKNCPFIPGAEKRIPLTYQDPKVFDNTDFEENGYKERSMQIASEMHYVFQYIKNTLS